MTVLAVLPAIRSETTESCLRSMLRPDSSFGIPSDELLVVDNSRDGWMPYMNQILGEELRVHRDPDGHNLGVAGSWNVAAREVLDVGHDYLVLVSTTMLFGPNLHTTFGAEMAKEWGAPLIESMGNSWHLIAIHRDVLQVVGLFDPNFYPAYEEAIDWGYRQKLAGLEVPWPRVWCNAMSLGWAMHVDRSTWPAPRCNGPALQDYYAAKWGGPKGSETFTTPFGQTADRDWWPEHTIPQLAEMYGLGIYGKDWW